MDGGSRTGHVVNTIHFHFEWIDYIMPHQLKICMIPQVSNILLIAGKKVVETDHLMSLIKQTLANVTSQKSGSSCD